MGQTIETIIEQSADSWKPGFLWSVLVDGDVVADGFEFTESAANRAASIVVSSLEA